MHSCSSFRLFCTLRPCLNLILNPLPRPQIEWSIRSSSRARVRPGARVRRPLLWALPGRRRHEPERSGGVVSRLKQPTRRWHWPKACLLLGRWHRVRCQRPREVPGVGPKAVRRTEGECLSPEGTDPVRGHAQCMMHSQGEKNCRESIDKPLALALAQVMHVHALPLFRVHDGETCTRTSCAGVAGGAADRPAIPRTTWLMTTPTTMALLSGPVCTQPPRPLAWLIPFLCMPMARP